MIFLRFGCMFDDACSWTVLGPSWAVLGRLGVILGPSWGHLGTSWVHLGPSWAYLGRSWVHLGLSRLILVASWPSLGPSGGHLGESCWVILGPSWAILGVRWGFKNSDFAWDMCKKIARWRCQLHFLITSSHLEASWAHLGDILGYLRPSGRYGFMR